MSTENKPNEVKAPIKSNKAKELMDKFGISEIYENSRGEFFLERSLAVASENGVEKKVQTYKK